MEMWNNCDCRGLTLELHVLHAFAEMTGITLRLHTGMERDTPVALLVYGPCMVVVVSGVTTSSPRATILQACMHNFMSPWRDGTGA